VNGVFEKDTGFLKKPLSALEVESDKVDAAIA
jgi:hypothetical protein